MNDQDTFNVLSQNPVSEDLSTRNDLPTETSERIKAILQEPIVLFMKGNAMAPQCGFSAHSTQLLESIGVPFKTYDILRDPELRQGLKDFSNWPTYPQLYVEGELLGGNDILIEMYGSGELQKKLEKFKS